MATTAKERKNAPGARTDPGWEHGTAMDEKGKNVKCMYCNEVRGGGINRLKHHLAGPHIDTDGCGAVPADVKQKFHNLLYDKAVEKNNKRMRYSNFGDDENDEVEILHAGGVSGKEKSISSSRSSIGSRSTGNLDPFVRKTKQTTLNQNYKKEEREKVCQHIARWFYTSAIPFNAVNNPEFPIMLDMVARYGIGLKPPSYHEIRVKFLNKEVQRTLSLIEEFKEEWKKTGCTIMSDGWTDRKRRSICNFLVNSPKGTVFLFSIDTSEISKTAEYVYRMLDSVVQQVGEENVVQVVTDNAANYKAAGEMLMATRPHLFWTPCAAHCIDLILEDFEKHLKLHKVTITKGRKVCTFIYARPMLLTWMKQFTNGKELIRPAVTRFATAYLTLARLHEEKSNLIRLFTSAKWKGSKFAKLALGKRVEGIILDGRGFWVHVVACLQAAMPLVKVLRMVDSDVSAMGFIYDAVERAKEKIAQNFNNVKKSYEPILEIIDKRWEEQLHRPLHAAAYAVNPQIVYSSRHKEDGDLMSGYYTTLARLCDRPTRVKITEQRDKFLKAEGMFGLEVAKDARMVQSPADWWNSFGHECPELQKFAIRVLSLTCTSSGCERNWSAFEMVHSKKRNRLHQQRMNDLVFIMYNLKLIARGKKRKELRKPTLMEYDEIPSDDEWIVEQEEPVLPTSKKWIDSLDRSTRREAREVSNGDCEFAMDEEILASHLEVACGDEIDRFEKEHVAVQAINDDDIEDVVNLDEDDENTAENIEDDERYSPIELDRSHMSEFHVL